METEVNLAAENQKRRFCIKVFAPFGFQDECDEQADLKTVAPLAVPAERLTRGYPAPLVALRGPPFSY